MAIDHQLIESFRFMTWLKYLLLKITHLDQLCITWPMFDVMLYCMYINNWDMIRFSSFILFQLYLYRVKHSVTLFFHGALLQSKIHKYKEHIYTHS